MRIGDKVDRVGDNVDRDKLSPVCTGLYGYRYETLPIDGHLL